MVTNTVTEQKVIYTDLDKKVKLKDPASSPSERKTPWTRKEMLELIREEARLILERAAAPGADEPFYSLEHMEWYLEISKDWAIVTLAELFNRPAGTLLDVGAYFGLIAGSAWRNGWKVSAADVVPLPNFSGLAAPERQVDFALCNAAVDPLPFPESSFDAVLLNEVLEHLMYPPAFLFNEIRRVLKPNGRLLLTTPNPAALSKIFRLMRGQNNEPNIDLFMQEETFTYKGRTFFKSQREAKIWTVAEMTTVLSRCGLNVVDYYYYGNTVADSRFSNAKQRLRADVNRWLRPLVKRNRLMGGGTMVVAQPK